jgi:hypothetical protein
VGGTVAGIAAKCDGRLELTGGEALAFRCAKAALRIPYRQVNTLEYGQKAGRRYAAALLVSPVLLLSKARKHFVTIGYLDESGRQQAIVWQVHKNDIRPALAGLEAKTGRRVEYQDEEARGAGR